MIYLDGSRFFFDIEGCFSDRVSAARLEHQADEHDSSFDHHQAVAAVGQLAQRGFQCGGKCDCDYTGI